VWLLVFFLVPFFIVMKLSLSDSATAIPPYTPVFSWSTGIWDFLKQLDFENYTFLFSDSLYINAYLSSLKIAFISTLLTLLVAYPMAYGMARAPRAWQPTLMMLVILPFWTSFLIRIYAWIAILKPEGFLNLFLMKLGIISEPLQIMNTTTAVYIGIVYSYLPFMILPLYASLERIDGRLIEAANDLYASGRTAFRKVTLPLTLPGIVAGTLLTFIPAMGDYINAFFLGGPNNKMIGNTIQSLYITQRDYPTAAALSFVLMAGILAIVFVYIRFAGSEALMGEEEAAA
jgi:putrescine transport system permease protein